MTTTQPPQPEPPTQFDPQVLKDAFKTRIQNAPNQDKGVLMHELLVPAVNQVRTAFMDAYTEVCPKMRSRM